MAVDTHVFRVAARIGLTVGAKNPLQAEEQLVKQLPEELIYIAHHWLILHGRYVCIARRPLCEKCGLQAACKFFNSEMKYVVAGTRKYDPEKDAVHKVDGGKKRRNGGGKD
jgi:endonuclease-3